MRLILVSLICVSLYANFPKDCEFDKECLIEVPGTQCADGTPSYITLTRRQNAKHLLVYMKGGGACWSGKSCGNGLARPLTRVEHSVEWNNGKGIHNHQSTANPFARDYDLISIPYCTGDAFIGDSVAMYTDSKKPMVIRHVGFKNVKLSLEMARQFVPKPDKAVLLGCSAGGIGAFFHLRNFRAAFPESQQYVISDAGLPIKPPHIYGDAYEEIMNAWAVKQHLQELYSPTSGAINDLGDVIRANTIQFQNTRFGLISSYHDSVMTFFGMALGTPAGTNIVHNNIIDIANNAIGKTARNARVFFTQTSTHCHTLKDIATISSLDTTLSNWMFDMVSDREWKSVRPDLLHRIRAANTVSSED